MTVPVHNLYDFVHQVTKRQYWLLYFYPWGERAIKNAIAHQADRAMLDTANGIAVDDRLGNPLDISENLEYSRVGRTQPIILCHDQEPLNYSLYTEGSEYAEQGFESCQSQLMAPLPTEFKNINLRLACPFSLQKTWILLHSEINSAELTRYESTGQFSGAYWWSHAVIARDWYRYAQHDLSLKPVNTPRKIFLAYCRDTTGSREYRRQFLDLLSHNKLTEQCQTTSFDNITTGPESSAVYNSEDFNNTAVSIVLETVFDNRIHLTEKTLRPIACGHPFILAAGPGSLRLMRSYGFHTFHGYINESYDEIQDSQERLAAIVAEMRRIALLPKNQFDILMQTLRSIADLNRQRFFSQEFHQLVVDELEKNVATAFATHNGELDFELWWHERRWRKRQLGAEFKQVKRFSRFINELVPLYRKQRLAQRVNREQ
jgi:hypothetical protein